MFAFNATFHTVHISTLLNYFSHTNIKFKSSDLDRTVCKSLPVYIHKLGIEYKDEVGKNDVIKNTISVTQKAPICKNTY